jgi:hypothetical protein
MSSSFSKTPIYVGMVIGSLLGGWVPVLFGADAISFTSLIGSVVGGIGGVVLAVVIIRRYF